MILHSPTEPASIVRLLVIQAGGTGVDVESSYLCETKGVDFLWRAGGRWFGVQRKEIHDLLASLDDGRLAKEIAQMNAYITMPMLVIEGRLHFVNDTLVTRGYGRPITRSQLTKRLLTIRSRDIGIEYAPEPSATTQFVVDTYHWSQAEGHSTAATRPKPSGDWGKPTSRDWQMHLLTALPGVGSETAAAILDTLGRCPLVLDADETELQRVPGIGLATARKIIRAVGVVAR